MGCHYHFLFLIMILFSYLGLMSSGEAPLAPALYVFGDSLFDSGNNDLLPTLAKANYLPYGADFADEVTGRFTNGRTVADFIAEFLKLPYAPPYVRLHKPNVLTGLNYASGACGILPQTGKSLGLCLSFGEQVDLYEKAVQSRLRNQFVTSSKLSEYLSKSIFIVSIGSNDYINNYLQPNLFSTSKRYSPPVFAQLLADALARQLERLYNLGARKIIMPELGPIGCIPAIAKMTKHTGRCSEETNQVVSYFNTKLPSMLKKLTSTLSGSIFVLGKTYHLTYDAIQNPSKYGFMDTSNPCCVTWLNGTSSCIPLLKSCKDPNTHFFFDGFHPTDAVNSNIARRLINGDATFSTPVNLKKLVQM